MPTPTPSTTNPSLAGTAMVAPHEATHVSGGDDEIPELTQAQANITSLTSRVSSLESSRTTDEARITTLEGLTEAKITLSPSFQLPSNSTTLTNVTGFGLTLLANAVWHFRMTLLYNCSAAADCKFAFTGPAGAVMFATVGAFTDASSTFHGGVGLGIGGVVNLLGSAATVGIEIAGTVVNGATPGALQLQAAQNSAVAENIDFIVVDTNLIATRLP